MANTQGICDSFKVDMLDFYLNNSAITRNTPVIQCTLHLATQTLGPTTVTAYTATGELAATGNYATRGETVTNATAPALDGTVAHWTPSANVVWNNLTASGEIDLAIFFNEADTTGPDAAIACFTFTAQTPVNGTFTLVMPTPDGTTGLVRVS